MSYLGNILGVSFYAIRRPNSMQLIELWLKKPGITVLYDLALSKVTNFGLELPCFKGFRYGMHVDRPYWHSYDKFDVPSSCKARGPNISDGSRAMGKEVILNKSCVGQRSGAVYTHSSVASTFINLQGI